MMKNKIQIILTTIVFLFVTVLISAYIQKDTDDRFVTYSVDPTQKQVKLYWKDNKQLHFKSIQNFFYHFTAPPLIRLYHRVGDRGIHHFIAGNGTQRTGIFGEA